MSSFWDGEQIATRDFDSDLQDLSGLEKSVRVCEHDGRGRCSEVLTGHGEHVI